MDLVDFQLWHTLHKEHGTMMRIDLRVTTSAEKMLSVNGFPLVFCYIDVDGKRVFTELVEVPEYVYYKIHKKRRKT